MESGRQWGSSEGLCSPSGPQEVVAEVLSVSTLGCPLLRTEAPVRVPVVVSGLLPCLIFDRVGFCSVYFCSAGH